MTDQELKDLVAGLAIKSDRLDAQQAKTDAQLAKTDAQLARTDAKLERIDEMVGGIANNQGDVAEEFFYNSLKAKPYLGGIEFDAITPNLIIGTKQTSSEFDIVLVNGQSVALVEVKYKAHVKDLDQLEQQIKRYRQLRPEHKDCKIYGGVAGFNVPDDVIKQAKTRGMFILQRKGEVIDCATDGMRAY